MKFAVHLAAHITPEWRSQYINYEELKQQLYEAVEQAPSGKVVDLNNAFARYFIEVDEAFFTVCDKELSKVNTFYSEKIAEAMRRFASLQHDLAAAYSMDVIEKPSYYTRKSQNKPPKKPSTKKLRKLETAFSEFYLSLVLLQNYQSLNYSGFRKILKKHDKLFSLKNGNYWRSENVDSAPFYVNKDTDRLIEETENVVTAYLEDGNRQRAMKRLHIPPIGEHQCIWTTFKLGLLMGIFLALFGIVICTASFKLNEENWKIAVRLYRGPLFVIIFLFLSGVNVYGWRTSGVNHILIFELDPRSHLSEQHIMEISMILGIFWTLSALGFVYSEFFGIPAYVCPLLLIFAIFTFVLNPSRTLFHGARCWFLRTLGRVIFSPFVKVNFADFWLAEQMTSLVPIFLDIQFFIYFHFNNIDWASEKYLFVDLKYFANEISITQIILICLPAWFRFAQSLRRYYDTKQSFPYIFNAIKYSTMFLVVLLTYCNVKYKKGNNFVDPNSYFYIWMISTIISIAFTFMWDIKMDWGLLNNNNSITENNFLREQIIYSTETYYYLAIVLNFILRFCWALSLSLPEISFRNGDTFVLICTPLEILRRFIWNFFRLENEHLNNCGEFRAIRDISIVPLETIDRDQEVILRMMDGQNCVITNRRKKNAIHSYDNKGKKIV